jgi:hypothetical protein
MEKRNMKNIQRSSGCHFHNGSIVHRDGENKSASISFASTVPPLPIRVMGNRATWHDPDTVNPILTESHMKVGSTWKTELRQFPKLCG